MVSRVHLRRDRQQVAPLPRVERRRPTQQNLPDPGHANARGVAGTDGAPSLPVA